MEIDYLRLILAALATFRIARLLPLDDGPLYIFERVRLFTNKKVITEQDELGFWHNLNDAVLCPYCQGLYVAIICAIVLFIPTIYGDAFLIIFALAGAQSLLQKRAEK